MFIIKLKISQSCKHSLQLSSILATHAIIVKGTQTIITEPDLTVPEGSSCYLPQTQPGLFDIGTEPSAYQPEPELLPLLPKGLAA